MKNVIQGGCKDFEGRNTCIHFTPNGSCKREGKYMCHVFIDTNSQPVADDVPLFLGEVLKAFPSAKVIKEINPEPRGKNIMEDFFGKI